MPSHPFLDHDGPLAFAHRGGATEAPENTMAAFEHAVGLGYRYLELDVRATADGEVVVFHDATLDRVTHHTGTLADRTLADLADVRVDRTEPIPRLVDVLDAWPDARINIDPKEDRVVEPLAELLEAREVLDRVCVMAFSDRRLRALRKRFGDRLCTALGPEGMTRLRLAASGVPLGRPPGHVAQVPPSLANRQLLDDDVMRNARRLGLPVHVWVVDYPGEMDRLLDLGVDGIMTDRPSVLRDVLVRRDAWDT
ncbi:MAG: glycerophosphodiester phosphodiesterase [Acidimicrobiia bacterium]|nr:glycerophosphodiester phosphodiesterase [Acidimicrobiia bacterium]